MLHAPNLTKYMQSHETNTSTSIMYTEHEEATEKFSRVSKVRETDRVSLCVQ